MCLTGSSVRHVPVTSQVLRVSRTSPSALGDVSGLDMLSAVAQSHVPGGSSGQRKRTQLMAATATSVQQRQVSAAGARSLLADNVSLMTSRGGGAATSLLATHLINTPTSSLNIASPQTAVITTKTVRRLASGDATPRLLQTSMTSADVAKQKAGRQVNVAASKPGAFSLLQTSHMSNLLQVQGSAAAKSKPAQCETAAQMKATAAQQSVGARATLIGGVNPRLTSLGAGAQQAVATSGAVRAGAGGVRQRAVVPSQVRCACAGSLVVVWSLFSSASELILFGCDGLH